MATQIDNIIIVNEQEVVTTSIDGYFKNLAIVAEFENAALLNSHIFSADGYEIYESLNAVAEVFPTTHIVYKYAQDAFTQKANTGVNKSAMEKLAVIQMKSTDSSFEAGLNRVGYADAYHFVCASNIEEDIISFATYFADKRKIPHAQTSDEDVLTDTTGNIAETLADASVKCALYYHSTNDEGLHAAQGAIHCFGTPGRIAGFYDKPSGITVDILTDNQKTKLDGNYVNYFTPFIGQAGSYMSRNLTAGGYLTNGTKIQKQVILDRIILNLQSAGMDALQMKIPYDDRGGAILEGKLKAVLRQLQQEQLIKIDSVDEDGEVLKGQELKVLSIAETKKDFNSYYAAQTFVVQASVLLALNAEKVVINLGYEV